MLYRAYQLLIASPIPLFPGREIAAPTESDPDVRIELGSVSPNGLAAPRHQRAFAQVGEDEVWLNIPPVGRFLIRNGNAITVEPAPGCDEESLRTYLLGSGLGALLHQRGHLVLHANAVHVGDGAVLFAGNSGAGKSTTAAVFHQRGYQIIADDVVAVDQQQRAIGGIPQLKLWQDTLKQLQLEGQDLSRIRPQLEKYRYSLGTVVSTPLPICAVYFLSTHNEHEDHQFEFHPLQGMAKFQQLKAHTYRRNFMDGLGLKPNHLQLCGQIANHIIAARILRPTRTFNATQLVDRVLEHLGQHGISTTPTP